MKQSELSDDETAPQANQILGGLFIETLPNGHLALITVKQRMCIKKVDLHDGCADT